MQFVKNHWQLILISSLIFLAWPYPLIWPLKMLVVFLHELSHALAAILTGGRVGEITLHYLQGGTTTTAGGNFFVIASAGYVGSLVLGAGLFMAAVRSTWDRILVTALGVLMLGVAAIYMREMFALGFTIAVAVALLVVAKFLPVIVNDLVLRVIGLTSMIYVPYDIFSDTLARSSAMSDARIIATEYGGPTVFWGGLWLVISLGVIFAVLRWGLKGPSNLSWRQIQLPQ